MSSLALRMESLLKAFDLFLVLTLASAIEAGVSTMYVKPLSDRSWMETDPEFFPSFVGLGEDPQVLAQRAPELFQVRTHIQLCARRLSNTPLLVGDCCDISASRTRGGLAAPPLFSTLMTIRIPLMCRYFVSLECFWKGATRLEHG